MKHEFELKLKFNFVVDEDDFSVEKFDDIGHPSLELCEVVLRQLIYMCNVNSLGNKDKKTVNYYIKPNSRYSIKDKTEIDTVKALK